MPLPRYGSKGKGVPVLDSRRAPLQAGGAAPGPVAPPPEEHVHLGGAQHLSLADRSRTVMANSRSGVLSIVHGTSPVGLVVPYALRENGIPLVGLRPGVFEVFAGESISDRSVTLAVAESPLTGSSANTCGGVTLLGYLRSIADTALKPSLAEYAVNQPADAVNIKNGEGNLYAIEPTGLWVTVDDGGYERVDAHDYSASSPDPLAHVAPTLVAHLSSDQGSALVLLCRAFGDQPTATAATMSGIDQHGMDLMVTTPHGRESVRVPFGQPVATPEEVRKELSAMIRGARFKLGMG